MQQAKWNSLTGTSKRFAVLLHGKNFALNMNGQIKKVGFFALRHVSEPSVETAKSRAIELLWSDETLSARLNAESDPPTIAVERISEVGWFTRRLFPIRGFSFYASLDESNSCAFSKPDED